MVKMTYTKKMHDGIRRDTAGKQPNASTDMLDEIDRLNCLVRELRESTEQSYSGMREAKDVIVHMLAFSWGAKQEAKEWLSKWYPEEYDK
jgi:hypothetical protein